MDKRSIVEDRSSSESLIFLYVPETPSTICWLFSNLGSLCWLNIIYARTVPQQQNTFL